VDLGHTLRDIADRAGVAVSTVSRVLNHSESTGGTTPARKRVLDVARELNYYPNSAAQALKRGFTGNIGLIVPTLNPSFQTYILGLERKLYQHGLRAMPFITHLSPKREAELLGLLPDHTVDAMISLHYMPENREFYRNLRERGYRLIFRVVDESLAGVDFDCVGINIGLGTVKLFAHLFQQGYRKIGFVGGIGAEDIRAGQFDRGHAQSYKLGHDEVGLPLDTTRAIPHPEDEQTTQHAYRAVTDALRKHPNNVDALIVQSTDKLLGTVQAVRDLGLRVPEDIGIATIGVETNPECEFLGITLWAQPAEAICTSLAELLIKRLNGEQDGPIEKIYHESQLIVRRSTMRNHPSETVNYGGFSKVEKPQTQVRTERSAS
jgi:LacI family transcriptional regulator